MLIPPRVPTCDTRSRKSNPPQIWDGCAEVFSYIYPQYVPVSERQNRRRRHSVLQNAPTYAHRRYGSPSHVSPSIRPRLIQPTPVPKGGGFVTSALLTAHGRVLDRSFREYTVEIASAINYSTALRSCAMRPRCDCVRPVFRQRHDPPFHRPQRRCNL